MTYTDYTQDDSREDHEPTLAAIPTYPTAALPEAMRELVRYGEQCGLPAALVGGAALGAVAAAIGGAATITITLTWHERAALWIPLIAPRGAGKSPAQGLTFKPLRTYDARRHEEDDDGILLGDTTVEALARDLAAAQGSAALDLDELSVMLRGMGEYKGAASGDRSRFLGLWTGDPWRYVRVGSSGKATNAIKLYIPQPTLVICGGLQPSLHELLGGDEDGLRPRWMPHLAAMPGSVGKLTDARAPGSWQALIDHLLMIRSEERTWKPSRAAREAFEWHQKGWKDAARGHESASISAALEKADRQLGRIALAFAEAGNPGEGGDVNPDTIDDAAMLVNFVMDCWRALPEQGGLSLSRVDEKLDRAIGRMVEWLEDHGGKASRRELQRAHVAGVRTLDDLGSLLERYEAIYPGSLTTARTKHGPNSLIVSAPRRRASSQPSPNGDTKESEPENPYEHWESDGVATGDSSFGDSSSGDKSHEASTNGSAPLCSCVDGPQDVNAAGLCTWCFRGAAQTDESTDDALAATEAKRTRVVKSSEPHDVYIGRPSKWGNPFVISKDGTRSEVIEKYERWLLEQPELLAALPELKGKVLGCHCSPQACHGDVLARLADEAEA